MAEKRRIRLVRAGFLLFCLVPTIGITAWAVARAASGPAVDKSLWEEELEWLLGLDVSIAEVARPEQGVTVLQGVEISDPETGPLARIGAIELARTEQGIVLIASQVEVQAEGLARVWELVHDRVLRSRRPTDLPIHFSASELTIQAIDSSGEAQAGTLVDCDGWIAASETGPQLALTFRRAGSDGAAAEFHLLRKNRQATPPATYWSLDTAGAPLPCLLVARQVPVLKNLGEGCQFSGKVWGQHQDGRWHGEFDGRLQNVDLHKLVTQRFPHLLSGAADIEVSAVLHDGRLQSATGSIHSPGGTIGRSLVEASCQAFPLKCLALETAQDKNWRYSELHFGFDVNVEGIKLAGGCDPLGEVLLLDQNGPLIERTTADRVAVLSLAEVLSRADRSQSRVTREGQALLEVLPLPSRPDTNDDRPPQGTLRLPNG